MACGSEERTVSCYSPPSIKSIDNPRYKPGDGVVYVEIDAILPPWDYFKNDKLDRYNYRIKVRTFYL